MLVGGWQPRTIAMFRSGVNCRVTAGNRSRIPFVAQRADAPGIDPKSPFTTIDGRKITPGEYCGGSNTDLN